MTEKERRWGQGREVEVTVPLNELVQKAKQVSMILLQIDLILRKMTVMSSRPTSQSKLHNYDDSLNSYIQFIRSWIRRPVWQRSSLIF
jgi:hypothetical protein